MANHDGWIGDKAPRQWAMDIYRLKSRQERQEMLEMVPDEYKEWVREYVTEWWNKRTR